MRLGVSQSVVHRSLLLLAALAIFTAPAAAFELFDGRLEVHGFFESQLRVLNEDFSEDWDVAQWYQVLDVEIELNIIDDTWMGIDLLSAFVRFEVRYDCVYSHGCGMFRSINAYGDKAQSLPRRLSSGNDSTTAGVLFIEHGDRLSGDTTDPVLLSELSGFRLIAETDGQRIYTNTLGNQQGDDRLLAPEPGEGCEVDSPQYFFCYAGPTPFSLNFEDFKDHKFTQLHTRTGAIARLGPWLPKNRIDLIATMSETPNPFDSAAVTDLLFVGYLDHNGFPVDYLNAWEDSDRDLNGNLPTGVMVGDLDANFQTDPTVDVTVNMSFPERPSTLVQLRLPLLNSNRDPQATNQNLNADLIAYITDAAGTGVSKLEFPIPTIDENGNVGTGPQVVEITYPRMGAGGNGAKPFRPTSIVDHDEAFYFGPDITEIEFNVDCVLITGGTRCTIQELNSTIEYDAAGLVTDTSDYILKFQEYYHELQNSMRTVCQTGDIGCFERVFTVEMDREGYDVQCGSNLECQGVGGTMNDSVLDDVIQQTFQRIQALECLESEWDCSDRLLETVEDSITAMEAAGFDLECDAGVDCDEEIAKYLIRFGTHYVISATRSDTVARGNYIPSRTLTEFLKSGRRTIFPFNLSESERAWNRGYAQNDEKELKEAYLDIELMDSRLWLRIGKQSIVWGKTELFRTTDQFNPQDFALASLGSLEETRINLWAFRGVYSLYEIGPLSDVRVEFAFNFDDFSASDLGACGEAFTVNVVCQLTLGSLVHGMTGIGVAGVALPPYRWYDPRSWEIGGRIEWRWDRFSFALTDFWGFNDLPTIEFITHFSRNVDPFSGRPRRLGYGGPCGTEDQDVITTRNAAGLATNTSLAQGYIDGIIATGSDGVGNPTVLSQYQAGNVPASCLRPGPTHREAYLADLPLNPDLSDLSQSAIARFGLREIPGVVNPLGQTLPVNNSYRAFITGNALDEHHANLNFFTWVCSSTVGFLSLDPNACAQTVFGSTKDVGSVGPISLLIGALVGGQPAKNNLLTFQGTKSSDFLAVSMPVVALQTFDASEEDLTNPGLVARREIENYNCFDPQHQGTGAVGGATPKPATFDFNPLNINNKNVQNVGCGLSQGKLSKSLTPEQEALLGCGPFFGTNCDYSGLDLLNAEASAMFQSFVGIEGTIESLDIFEQQMIEAGRGDVDIYFRTDGWIPFLEREMNGAGTATLANSNVDPMLQPGTVRWRQAGISTPTCTTNDLAGRTRINAAGNSVTAPRVLPGCRGLRNTSRGDGSMTAAAIVSLSLSTGRANNFARQTNFTDKHARASDEGFFINEDFFMFHAYVEDSPELFDVASGEFIKYPGILCSPDPGSVCHDDLVGFDDKPEYHNQWDEGYNINVDGSPFELQLKRETAGSGVPLRLPGMSLGASFVGPPIAPNNKPTPNCPDCATLLTQFASGTNNQLGNGQPFTGDIFTSEIAGFSYNFMMLLVTFDGEFQRIMQTITSGPTGGDEIPRSIGRAFIEPYEVALGTDPSNGNCHEDIRATGGAPVNDDATNIRVCGIERRRFAVHYAYSGDEWGTREATDPDFEFIDPWLTVSQGTPFTLDYDYVENRFVGMEILKSESAEGSGEFIKAGAHCSFITPQNCEIVQNIFAIAGVQHRSVKAGGNGEFGRRTFIWHSGGEIIAKFDRRNVLGLAMDFAEDVTKSNWGVEFTWVEGVRVGDYDEWDGLTTVNDLNLTISIDRPTFIDFLNPNHTFFMNTQWFFKYRDGWSKSMPANGPVNILGLVFVQTGYFQDRLLPAFIAVYDFMSGSGAVLPQVTFRYAENFSVIVGANIFMGKEQIHEMPISGIGPASNQRGEYAYKVGVENGIALVRDRDEVFMRLRYTF
jgi:hypothetical protein